jgi:hypothetical protein
MGLLIIKLLLEPERPRHAKAVPPSVQPTARNDSRDRIDFKQPFGRSRAVVTT